MTTVTITRVAGSDLPDLARLRQPAAVEGHSFVERTHRDWLDGSNRFDDVGEAFLLAWGTSAIVGMCGLNRDPFADDPAVGRLRHLYVAPPYRGKGIGRRLVTACLGLADGHFTRVRLRTLDDEAARFYERLGFTPVAEDAATHTWEL